MIIPRPYQQDSRVAVWKELDRVQSTLAVLPTGCGKTVLFSLLASDWLERFPEDGRVLVLAHRKELLDQAKAKLEAVARVPVGVDRAAERANPGDRGLFPTRVVVGCVPTLAKESRRARYNPEWPWLVVVDECHHVRMTRDGRGGNSYARVLRHFTSNPRSKVVGVTATPKRTDGVGLGNCFQSLACRVSIRDAIHDGWLVDGIFCKPVVEGLDFSGVRDSGGDLDADEVADIATRERPLHEVALVLKREAAGRKVIVFCANRRHVQALHEVLARPDYFGPDLVASADGKTPEDQRADVLGRFREGRVRVLVNCNLLTEGFDCLSDDTDILTDKGWVGIDAAEVGGNCYSLNRKTGEMELVPMEWVGRRDLREGERMVSIKSQHLDLLTTEGHEFHVKYRDPRKKGNREQQLSDNFLTLTGSDLLARSSEFHLPLAAAMGGLPGLGISDDELRLVAWAHTDGYLTRSGAVELYQSEKVSKHAGHIRELLNRLGVTYSEGCREPNDGTGHGYASKHGLITFYVHAASVSHLWPMMDKLDLSALHSMDRRQFNLFWSELLLGNGSKSKPNASGWLWLRNKEQADAIQAMAIVRGFACNQAPFVTNAGLTVYRVSVRDVRWMGIRPADSRAAKITVAAGYSGRVWCVRNCNGTIVIRRKGKVAISGNCPDAAVLANCRPTKSLIVATQIVGRVLRPLDGVVDGKPTAEERLAAIAASAKPAALLLDFTGRTLARQGAVDAIDVLRGDEEESVKQAARQVVRRGGAVDFDAALHRARVEEAIRVEQAAWERRSAVAASGGSYRVERQGSLSGGEPSQKEGGRSRPAGGREPREVPAGQRPTARQAAALRWLGVPDELIETYTRRQAGAVITSELRRQGKELRKRG